MPLEQRSPATTDSPCFGLASQITPSGHGGIASVAIWSSSVEAVLQKYFRGHGPGRKSAKGVPALRVGTWAIASGHEEEVVLLQLGPETVEVHCHGGATIVGQILSSLENAGLTVVPWWDWLAARDVDPISIEVHQALAQAKTPHTASILLRQLDGRLNAAANQVIEHIVRNRLVDAQRTVNALLRYEQLGLHLVNPWRVVLAGEPNVGKSSLINAIMGYQRAIVDSVPGTTRDVLVATTALNGWPVEFADTAGVRDADDPVESSGIDRAHDAIRSADLVLWISDSGNNEPNLQYDLSSLEHKVIRVRNKVDLIQERDPTPDVHICQLICTSALTGEGLSVLLSRIAKSLVPEEPGDHNVVPFTERQLGALHHSLQLMEGGESADAVDALRSLTQGPTHQP